MLWRLCSLYIRGAPDLKHTQSQQHPQQLFAVTLEVAGQQTAAAVHVGWLCTDAGASSRKGVLHTICMFSSSRCELLTAGLCVHAEG